MKYLSKEPLVMPVGTKASEETWIRVFGKTDAVGSEKCKATLEVKHNG